MKMPPAFKTKQATVGLTAGTVILAIIAWSQLAPSLEFIVRIQKAPEIAEAAQSMAQSNREFIDAWIAQQEADRKMREALAKQEQEYQKQMLEMQQQQIQQQPYYNQSPAWTEYDDYGNPYCTDGYNWRWGTC